MPDSLHLLEIEDGVRRLRARGVVPSDLAGVEVDDALDVLGGRLLDAGDGNVRNAGRVDGVDVHVRGQPGHELALETGNEIDDARGNVADLEDLAEGDGRERTRFGGDG